MTINRRGRYRSDPVALAGAAFTSPWQATHGQLVVLAIEVAHRLGWLVTVTHDSRTDHWAADSGWPDLFAAKGGRAVAIEVKAPPDDLSVEQRAWWTALSAVPGIDAVVFRSCGDRVRDAAAIVELLA